MGRSGHWQNIHTALVLVAVHMLMLIAFARGQEAVGLSSGNYGGISVLRVNPAHMMQSGAYLQLNLVSSSSFFQNNFVYWQQSDMRIPDVLNDRDAAKEYFTHLKETLTYYQNTSLKSMSLAAGVIGPGFMLHTGRWAFGAYTAVRSYASITNLPYEIPVFVMEDINFKPLHNIRFVDENANIAMMNWAEVGASLAHTLIRDTYSDLSVGFTVRRLYGISAFFMKGNFADYTVLSAESMDIRKMDFDFGIATSIDLSDKYFSNAPSHINGKGWGLDVGVNYTRRRYGYNNNFRKKICEKEAEPYVWRIGVSLLDAGSIGFAARSQLHSFMVNDKYLDQLDTIRYTSVQQMIADASKIMLGDSDASYRGNHFRLGLPTAISLQFDYALTKKVFVNTMAFLPVKTNKYTLLRPAQIYIVPRYETPYLEFSLPLSLYDYRIPRIGAAVRFGFLTIGTERISNYLGISNLTGLDVYASIQLFLERGHCLFDRKTGACQPDDAWYGRRKRSVQPIQ